MQPHQNQSWVRKKKTSQVNLVRMSGGIKSVKVFLKKRKEKKGRSYLAVLQVGVDVFDQCVVRVTSREGQLTQRTAADGALF